MMMTAAATTMIMIIMIITTTRATFLCIPSFFLQKDVVEISTTRPYLRHGPLEVKEIIIIDNAIMKDLCCK